MRSKQYDTRDARIIVNNARSNRRNAAEYDRHGVRIQPATMRMDQKASQSYHEDIRPARERRYRPERKNSNQYLRDGEDRALKDSEEQVKEADVSYFQSGKNQSQIAREPNEVRLKIGASAHFGVHLNGDLEGKSLQIVPAEDGMAELIITGRNKTETSYISEKSRSNRQRLIFPPRPRGDAEESYEERWRRSRRPFTARRPTITRVPPRENATEDGLGWTLDRDTMETSEGPSRHSQEASPNRPIQEIRIEDDGETRLKAHKVEVAAKAARDNLEESLSDFDTVPQWVSDDSTEAHFLKHAVDSLDSNWKETWSKIPDVWKWDLEYYASQRADGTSHRCWTCTPLEPDEPKLYPLTVASAPVVLPVKYQWPPAAGLKPPPDPRPLTPIDCREELPLDIVRDLCLTFEDSVGFYVLISGLIQVIVPEAFNMVTRKQHFPSVFVVYLCFSEAFTWTKKDNCLQISLWFKYHLTRLPVV